jgi:hypothetical protein
MHVWYTFNASRSIFGLGRGAGEPSPGGPGGAGGPGGGGAPGAPLGTCRDAK